ncbi:MAG TPA: bifunctional diaminohydroxyphosphoribosylaminopyrimidine deaminase/5-amino-6-(5-phosphoribosylamino)uracil reductase RibD [Acidimicrobiales bacterium]|jgi:diaminohydroxyphosphoribosylaminopyrimidine deaminase/5-amino-6-(5-phosphoribosylamino)uracil reductase|nr:bifunctional diaminohydroxyphosphoribosylaminopyrimidine deaminase/5-amino-6-(5-phosphoribosylamino)uracil reductase RibD [Acidimicrobiales bacterium]
MAALRNGELVTGAGRDDTSSRGSTADENGMAEALAAAATVRATTSPNPWVGAVVVTGGGSRFAGATQPPGGSHAEVAALQAAREAGADPAGATVYVTLEPCSHHGRTPPCVDALVAANVARVVVAVEDPDRQVSGAGIAALRAAGIDVTVGVGADRVEEQLAPYLVHRRTGRPFVVLKVATTLDGRTAAPDGTSRWITGPEARADVHRLRAESDAVLVGAGTVRVDDPALTVRDGDWPGGDPLRVVLGHAPERAKVHPCVELSGPLDGVLDELGGRGVVQLLVEGGPTVAAGFHRAGLVDRYVWYVAPALFGGDDARPAFIGAGAPTIDAVWRGSVASLDQLGADVRVVIDAVRG